MVNLTRTAAMASPAKVAFHAEKLRAYLTGEPVFPVTVEMDITTFCPRKCQDCPSTRSPEAKRFELGAIDRFFSQLEGQTKGLLLSGGEPTSSPDFPDFLQLARRRGFEEIAVVSNGAHLGQAEVTAALLEHVTILRLSLYDWEEETQLLEGSVLRQMDELRKRIDDSGSDLHIGVSALTDSGRIPSLEAVTDAVAAAGAHWIYFHPICTGWGTGALSQTDQEGVPEEILRLQSTRANGFGVHYCPPRYETNELEFDEYHAAHFLMVVGADGVNYLGTETKYQSDYAIARAGDADFLRRPERLERIGEINHRNYPPLGGRHRGLLYNNLIQQLKDSGEDAAIGNAGGALLYPHIL
jgi:hypothetical protein